MTLPARAIVFPAVLDGNVAVGLECVLCAQHDLITEARAAGAVPDRAHHDGRAESYFLETLNAVVAHHYQAHHPEHAEAP